MRLPEGGFMKNDDVDPIDIALREDLGQGDVTTDFFVPETARASARIVAREKAITAGEKTAAEVFRRVDPTTDVQILRDDGAEAAPDDLVIEIRGLARSIL